MSREWDRENMQVVSVNMRKEAAEKFRMYAEEKGTTRGALLRGFAESCIKEEPDYDEPGVMHPLTYRNTDRLKHEAAFHNPDCVSPSVLLNRILDDYFDFVEKVRK